MEPAPQKSAGHEPAKKLSKDVHILLAERLHSYWIFLKHRFASQAQDDIARAQRRLTPPPEDMQ